MSNELFSWPDGSLKWTGHALGADSGLADSLKVSVGTPSEPSSPVSVSQSKGGITVTTGSFSGKSCITFVVLFI